MSPIAIIAGAIMMVLSHNGDRVFALGALLILIGAWFLFIWPIRIWGQRQKKKEEVKKNAVVDKEKIIDEAYEAFCNRTDYPELNTIRLVDGDMVFEAEGRYVLEPYFKKVPGDHFAFEIKSTSFKSMADDYDDYCDLQSSGVLISAGYHDGEALEKYANDNGIILPEPLNRMLGKAVKLRKDKGYKLEIWTVEGDEPAYGFVKIVKCENGVLTVFFTLTESWAVYDSVEGLVELKKESTAQPDDINSLIDTIKRKQYNVIEVPADEIKAIKDAHPFLPDGYIRFISEVGFADMDWVDVGRNEKTPANLNDYEVTYLRELTEGNDDAYYENFYFFALDNGDTYYAFSKKPDDQKVYIFNDDGGVSTFASFEEFLFEILTV